MITWVFVIVLLMPSYGGKVKATIETLDEASCLKIRRVIVQQFGGEHNINGTVSDCAPVTLAER